MSTFVLIHGAWHGGWCWNRLAPLLRAAGHTVVAPDLPGMGSDPLPLRQATLELWAQFVADLARAAGEPVVLVGHSRGGPVISQAAELAAEHVLGLVYLTAILLPDGGTVMDLAKHMPASDMTAILTAPDGASSTLDPAQAADLLYNTTEATAAAQAVAQLCRDPTAPNVTPLRLTPERFGSLPRAYVECLRDQTLTIALQRIMHEAMPCDPVITLDTDHSPFLSAPEPLRDALLTCAQAMAR